MMNASLKLVSYTEAGMLLGASRKTVGRWVRDGALKGVILPGNVYSNKIVLQDVFDFINHGVARGADAQRAARAAKADAKATAQG